MATRLQEMRTFLTLLVQDLPGPSHKGVTSPQVSEEGENDIPRAHPPVRAVLWAAVVEVVRIDLQVGLRQLVPRLEGPIVVPDLVALKHA